MRSLKRYLLCLATAVFALSLTAGLAVTAGAEGETDPAFTALKSEIESATEGTVKEIRIDGDLTVSETLTFKAGMSYVIYAEKDVTVTLGENMTSSPMFALPEDGKVGVCFGKSTDDAGTITFDGNKNAFAERTGVGFLTVGKASSAGNGSTVEFRKATVRNFVSSTVNGTAITVNANNSLKIDGGRFEGNEKKNNATNVGQNGTIYVNASSVEVNGGEFVGNTHAGTGGGVFYVTGAMTMTVNGGLFENNASTNIAAGKGYGGAVYVNNAKSTLNVYGGTFRGNSAVYGGAIAVKAAKSLTVGGQEGKTPVFESNDACLGGDVAVISATACSIDGSVKDVYNESEAKAFYMAPAVSEISAAQGKTSDLFARSEGLGVVDGSFLYTDADNYCIYRAVFAAGTKTAGFAFRVTGGGVKAEFRNVRQDVYTELSGLSAEVTQWQTFFVDSSVLNADGTATTIEVRFSDPTPEDGGGTQVHDFKFVKGGLTDKKITVDASTVSVNLTDDIAESYAFGDNLGTPYADGYAFFAYDAVFPADAEGAGMVLKVNGVQENIYVGYSVNGGEYVETDVTTGVEGKFCFEGLERGKENLVNVKFYAKLKQGGGPNLTKLSFVRDGKTHRFDGTNEIDLGNVAENLFEDNGSAVAGAVRYVDGTAYMTYRVVFPAGTKVARMTLIVGGTNTAAGESPKVEFRNIESEDYVTAELASDLARQQTIDLSSLLNAEGETVVEVRIGDPSPADGGGTQLMGISFKKNVANDRLLRFAEDETSLTVDLIGDIDEGIDYGNAANTPFADCAAYYAYRVEFPSNAIDPFVRLTVNGSNQYVSYSVNGGETREILLESGVEGTVPVEGFVEKQVNVLTLLFGAKDTTQGSGANLKAIAFGFTDGETVITGIRLDRETAQGTVGETIVLTADVTGGSKIDRTVVWTSDDESVATVENGEVKAVGEGTVTITATAADGKTAVCTIEISAALAESESAESVSSAEAGGCFGGIGGSWIPLIAAALFASVRKMRKKEE